MHRTYAAHPVTPHRRSRDLIVDDSGDITATRRATPDRDPQAGQPETTALPKATWLHGVLGAAAVFVSGWLAYDWISGLRNPVVSGHLRAAFIAFSVSLAVVVCTHRLYLLLRPLKRLVTQLHERLRWFEGRAEVRDQRDAEFRAWRQAVDEDMALVGRAIADVHRILPEIAAAVGYANANLNTISRQVISIGGGQAAVAGAVDQLAHVMTHMVGRQGAADRQRREETGGADEWRTYLRDGRELDEEQLRFYLMGIYDREQRSDEGPDPVA